MSIEFFIPKSCSKDARNAFLNKIYMSRKDNPTYNTSYPLSPSEWKSYLSDFPLDFSREKTISLYVHIPFCRQLCSFCEYTRMICPDEQAQSKYVQTIENDIQAFLYKNRNFRLQGFDIGGGTPTSLSEKNFSALMGMVGNVIAHREKCPDFEPSVEATFQTVSVGKLNSMAENGIRRISLGVQSASSEIAAASRRCNADIMTMEKVISMAHNSGIKKVNLDFMYGLKNQSLESLQADIELVKILRPEQITLYELRINMIREENHRSALQKYEMYCRWYESLAEMGYMASFGQNTFSLNEQDMGVSSYLRHRMRDGTAYKGFGISAQSLSSDGLSYNIGKNSPELKNLLGMDSYSEEYTYRLPREEMASKYIAIAAYSGAFSLKALDLILGGKAEDKYSTQLQWCLERGLLKKEGDMIRITRKGFRHYGAVFSLFYDTDYAKENYLL